MSPQAAERDWEEKRASLTQYSAQDINRLLEETQAELMKAIPDLDFAAKQIKPAQNQIQNQNQSPSITNATPEHKPNKPQNKLSSKECGSRRGSDELTVARYRTEKPSKSPPPPPPRRSFPSSPGLTTRSGEMIIPGKCIKVTGDIQNDTHTQMILQVCVYACKRSQTFICKLFLKEQHVDRQRSQENTLNHFYLSAGSQKCQASHKSRLCLWVLVMVDIYSITSVVPTLINNLSVSRWI